MSDTLPAPVAVTDLPDGARYRLPGRPWGQPAALGLGALVVGLLGTAFISFWLWGVGSPLFRQGRQPGDGMLVVFLLFGGWMLLMMLRLVVPGLFRLVCPNQVQP